MAAKGQFNARAAQAMLANPAAFSSMAANPNAWSAVANNANALRAIHSNAAALGQLSGSVHFQALMGNPSFANAMKDASFAASLANQNQ
jgi:hypothetical protein